MYGCYYFLERIITGIVLYILISNVYLEEDDKIVRFSWIFLPFILYAGGWVLVMICRSIKPKSEK